MRALMAVPWPHLAMGALMPVDHFVTQALVVENIIVDDPQGASVIVSGLGVVRQIGVRQIGAGGFRHAPASHLDATFVGTLDRDTSIIFVIIHFRRRDERIIDRRDFGIGHPLGFPRPGRPDCRAETIRRRWRTYQRSKNRLQVRRNGFDLENGDVYWHFLGDTQRGKA